MKRRRKLSKGRSKRQFRRGARTKRINVSRRPMRGGWRL